MKQQNHYAYDIPAEYADIIDPSKVNLSDFALFLAVMKRKKAHECVLSIILGEPDLKLNQVHVEEVVLNAKGERASGWMHGRYLRIPGILRRKCRMTQTSMMCESDQGFIRDFWTVRY